MNTEEKVAQLRIGDTYECNAGHHRMRIGENKWIFLANNAPNLNGCPSCFTDREIMSMTGMKKVKVEYNFTPEPEKPEVGCVYQDPYPYGDQRMYIGNDEWICLDGQYKGQRSTLKTEEILLSHRKVV